MAATLRFMLGMLLCVSHAAWAAQGEIIARPLGTVQGINYGYWEYLPLGYDDNTEQTYPLVIFLGGVGEVGNGSAAGLEKLMAVGGPPKLIRNGRDFPFVLISPQRFNAFFGNGEIDAIFAFAKSHYRIDPSRIYLTGISAGGIVTWNYAVANPQKLAAIVPIAGNGNGLDICKLNKLPVWAFHGTADTTVSPYGSIEPVNKLNTTCSPVANPPALITLYPGVGHDSWSRTYSGSAGHDVYTWMLSYSLAP
ncbi:dienelactone hydrolase family protein [Stigmatella sp. ncwal1]|uniref:Dienelactone hydrolase family protein n=1 Tax=Stigmatella ashevillensis TaxID=2995309 RepID=A0ABT5DF93_9BACT|nr:dienelactone hydrolase family protein [Stigmatella ashevillena]MDC0712349.1 dienelactone hydrolase family protein [Stigmatella ashevillena]